MKNQPEISAKIPDAKSSNQTLQQAKAACWHFGVILGVSTIIGYGILAVELGNKFKEVNAKSIPDAIVKLTAEYLMGQHIQHIQDIQNPGN